MSELKFRIAMLKCSIKKIQEKVIMAIVWKLPRTIILWSSIRMIAHATTNEYGSTIVPELTAMDALKRWGDS